MTARLKAALLDSGQRGEVVNDLESVLDQEVADKSGLSGGVVKTGYAAVKRIKPGIIWGAVDSLLDESVDALEPHWDGYQAQPATGFGAYLAARPGEVSDSLLAVTDRRAERSHREAVKSAYAKLRPGGQRNVVEALPRLGQVIEKHAG